LTDPALTPLATIVRGADTGRPELAPQAAGLLAVSLGLSAIVADDHELLKQGMVVYDALYEWCRSCQGEVHELAEAEGHHPEISFGWGYAIVSLRTKKIKGLHENDFIMAAKINRLAQLAGTGGVA